MMHHTSLPSCDLCESKLMTAHSSLGAWFRKVKAKYPNVHVSWGFRNMAEQEEMYRAGRELKSGVWVVVDQRKVLTNARFGQSPHNHMEGNKPMSQAVDLFLIDEDGEARWPKPFFSKLAAEELEPGMVWGGTFKSMRGGDADHYQLNEQTVSC
jgi:hypothetical protein